MNIKSLLEKIGFRKKKSETKPSSQQENGGEKPPCPTSVLFYIATGKKYHSNVEPWYEQIKSLSNGADKWAKGFHAAVVAGISPEVIKAIPTFNKKFQQYMKEKKENEPKEVVDMHLKRIEKETIQECGLKQNYDVYNLSDGQKARINRNLVIANDKYIKDNLKDFTPVVETLGLALKDNLPLTKTPACLEHLEMANAMLTEGRDFTEGKKEDFPELYDFSKKVFSLQDTGVIDDKFNVVDVEAFKKSPLVTEFKFEDKNYNLSSAMTKEQPEQKKENTVAGKENNNNNKPCPTSVLLYIASGIQSPYGVEPWYEQIKNLSNGADKWAKGFHDAVIEGINPKVIEALPTFKEKVKQYMKEKKENVPAEIVALHLKRIEKETMQKFGLPSSCDVYNLSDEQKMKIDQNLVIANDKYIKDNLKDFTPVVETLGLALKDNLPPTQTPDSLEYLEMANAMLTEGRDFAEGKKEDFPELYDFSQKVFTLQDKGVIDDKFNVVDVEAFKKSPLVTEFKFEDKNYNLSSKVATPTKLLAKNNMMNKGAVLSK